MSTPPPPFSIKFSPQLPELMSQLNCTLALSTYQAGKVIFISAKDDNELVQLPRNFDKAMGLALKKDKMAVALRDEVVVLKDSPELAKAYPDKPNVYDGMYMPRLTYYTGALDIHDMEWCGETLTAVNTSFSCIIEIDGEYSYRPVWTPAFISDIASEDRCHLNGMAVKNDKPYIVSAFAATDSQQGWRDNITETGILIDYDSKEIVSQGLGMPHSPRIFNGRLIVLLSATGQIMEVDEQSGKTTELLNLGVFVRGMDLIGDYLFVGVSKLRKNSSTFAKLEIAEKSDWCGVEVIHFPTMARVGRITYQASVDEIYDVKLIPNRKRLNVINTMKDLHKRGLHLPNTTFWARDLKQDNG